MARCLTRMILATATVATGFCAAAGEAVPAYSAGVARIDITPDYPVRLAGYAVRKGESTGVAQHIYAKALVISDGPGNAVLLLTVDNCGVPMPVRREVASRLAKSRNFPADRLAICSTHTHSAPWVNGYLGNLFSGPIPSEQQARVDRYTGELTDALEKVALQALSEQSPARLARAVGRVSFAANRRTKGGPVDRELPVMFVTSPEGQLRAVFATYACHCTTLTGEFNQICGDWAGYAQEDLEREHPGAIALISLGCAGDANPDPRPGWELAKQHGQAVAAEVKRLQTKALIPVGGALTARYRQIELPLEALPTRAEWQARAKETNYVGSHARLNLARLDRDEALPTTVDYPVQTWSFGDNLTLVFLGGEVVVDYSLRLKRELDAARLWINAYANDVPCYIPSERVLKEGGYEGATSMIFYDKPARFAPGLEGRIMATVRELVPSTLVRTASADNSRNLK